MEILYLFEYLPPGGDERYMLMSKSGERKAGPLPMPDLRRWSDYCDVCMEEPSVSLVELVLSRYLTPDHIVAVDAETGERIARRRTK